MLDKKLLALLVCPLCKGELVYDGERHRLICEADKLAYPIKNDIPVMLPDEAQPWKTNE